jgi:hypothetical protein
MAESKFSSRKLNINISLNLTVIIGIVIIIAVLAYFFIKGGIPFLQPSGQKTTYTGNKTIVQSSETGIEMYPTNGQTIRGLMTIKLTKAPKNTAEVWFGLVPKSQYTDKTDPNLGFDPDGSNGWSLDFYTKDIVNGEYTVFIVPKDSSKNNIDRIFANVVVEN